MELKIYYLFYFVYCKFIQAGLKLCPIFTEVRIVWPKCVETFDFLVTILKQPESNSVAVFLDTCLFMG